MSEAKVSEKKAATEAASSEKKAADKTPPWRRRGDELSKEN